LGEAWPGEEVLAPKLQLRETREKWGGVENLPESGLRGDPVRQVSKKKNRRSTLWGGQKEREEEKKGQGKNVDTKKKKVYVLKFVHRRPLIWRTWAMEMAFRLQILGERRIHFERKE